MLNDRIKTVCSWITTNILPGVIVTVILLLIIETGFRLLSEPENQNTQATSFIEPDPDLIWRLKKNNSQELKTNTLGFRDFPYNQNADYKILLLGDSISWGDGIQYTKNVYPQILEKKLNQIYQPKSIEVINTAVPGYSTFQQLRYLKKYGLKLEPNLIILQFCLNDVTDHHNLAFGHGSVHSFLGLSTIRSKSFNWILENSYAAKNLLHWVQKKQRSKQTFTVEQLSKNNLDPKLEKAWKLTESELAELFALAKSNDIAIMLLIAPYKYQTLKPNNTNQPQVRLKNIAKKRKVPALDLLPYFVSAKEKHGGEFFHDANHFNNRGHEVAAHYTAEAIRKVIRLKTIL